MSLSCPVSPCLILCGERTNERTVGPAVEAFGFQRILFGSSAAAPLAGASSASNAGDWFELARESFAELGLEQEDLDAVFAQNARLAYAAPSS